MSSGKPPNIIRAVKEYDYTPIAEAMTQLKKKLRVLPSYEIVNLNEAYGRVLAEDIVPDVDVPRFNSSLVDGYAVKSGDTKDASAERPARLRVKGRIGLTEIPSFRISAGEAGRVLTGGFIPDGTDAVVPVEVVHISNGEIAVEASVAADSDLYPAGADISRGLKLLSKGRVLRAPDLGMLGTVEIPRVKVFKKPLVAVVAVGSELTENLDAPAGKVPATHSLVISKVVEGCGGIANMVGIAADRIEDIVVKLKDGLSSADMILTIGGTSMGEHDLVAGAVQRCGRPGMIAHGVRLDPGRVTGVGAVDGKPIVLLPGLIQSAMNGFIVFAYPLMRQLAGFEGGEPPMVSAVLTEGKAFRRKFISFTKVCYVKLWRTDDGLAAKPFTGTAAMMRMISEADGYILAGEEVAELREGEKIDVRLLPGFSHAEGHFSW